MPSFNVYSRAGVDAAIASAVSAVGTSEGGYPPATFRRWRGALAKVRAGVANAKILCVGDSITEGWDGGNVYDSYPYVLAGMLDAYHAPAIPGAIYTPRPRNITGADPRITLGAGWSNAVTASSTSSWGRRFALSAGAVGTLDVAFAHQIDTINVYWRAQTGQSVLTVKVDGATSLGTTRATGATAAIVKDTFTTTPGAHTINISGDGTLPGNVFAVEAFDSTQKRVLVDNAGVAYSGIVAGWSRTDAGDVGVGPFPAVAPDLTVILLGTNDAGEARSTASVVSAMAGVVAAAKGTGDVLLCSITPRSDAQNQARVDSYNPALKALAASHGVGFIDLAARFGTHAEANASGLMADAVHPGDAGTADIAAAVFRAIVAT